MTALLGPDDPLLPVSAKTGEGVNDVLEAIVQYIPAPASIGSEALAALAFDSWYDEFKGVVSLIAVKSGYIKKGESDVASPKMSLSPSDLRHLHLQATASHPLSMTRTTKSMTSESFIRHRKA